MTAVKMSQIVYGRDEMVSEHQIPADVTSVVSSVEEILGPLETVPAESAGFDFTTVLGLLGEAYTKKLCALRKAEEHALQEFHETYQDYLRFKSGGKSTTSKKLRINVHTPANKDNHFHQFSSQHTDYEINYTPKDVVVDKELNLSSRPYKELSKVFPEVFETKSSRELWQKKITVPEPFNMTIREEEKQYKKRNSISLDSSDTPVRFHSNPVPAHVHLPMYHIIAEQSEKLRQERIDNRKQKLLAQVKPFHLSFASKPTTSTLVRSQSLTNLSCQSSKFNASPYPLHLFEESTRNEKEISENLRRVRIKARAEEMYKQSSSPFSERKTLKHWNSAGSLNSSRQVQRKASTVSRSSKHSNVQTVTIKDRISSGVRHASCIPNYQTSAIVRPTVHVIHSEEKPVSYKLTKSAILRKAKREKEEEVVKQRKDQELAAKSNRKTVQMQLQKEVALKIKMHNQIPCSEETIRQKLASHRRSQQSRLDDHSKEMQDMKERLKKRPLLIEQQVQKASRDAAARRFQTGKAVVNYMEIVPKASMSSRSNSPEQSGSEGHESESENEADSQTAESSQDVHEQSFTEGDTD